MVSVVQQQLSPPGQGRYGCSEAEGINGAVTSTGCEASPTGRPQESLDSTGPCSPDKEHASLYVCIFCVRFISPVSRLLLFGFPSWTCPSLFPFRTGLSTCFELIQERDRRMHCCLCSCVFVLIGNVNRRKVNDISYFNNLTANPGPNEDTPGI